ncbi:helix-turn-helix domain-containing protein [Muricoccus pecuniae]|uniref:Transcriptional regulator with XRE-family HTH domain n=1 Tax=Muricoccus pecuniae TaxID=693023 RepID=A0A840Y0T7_9PROT|nr:cupin domain-containing protein [Roseomonas pecuniae]MBB5694728.1 transcriptional regulator with XRE-family HTH domain [Roseomonas pecuniae]
MTLAKPAPATQDGAKQIGAQLRALRAERGLTILELAAKAGLSAGLISQIERGNSNPSMRTIQRLRSALGINIWEFFGQAAVADEEEPPFVRRRDRRGRIVVGRTRLVKELLSPRSDSALRFMLITLPPGGVSEDVLVGRGEKGGYVLSGRVELTVDGRRSELSEGDSFQFESHLPHQLANPTGEEAVVFWIMSVLEGHF